MWYRASGLVMRDQSALGRAHKKARCMRDVPTVSASIVKRRMRDCAGKEVK